MDSHNCYVSRCDTGYPRSLGKGSGGEPCESFLGLCAKMGDCAVVKLIWNFLFLKCVQICHHAILFYEIPLILRVNNGSVKYLWRVVFPFYVLDLSEVLRESVLRSF